MNKLPTREEALNLLSKVGCSNEVITHCKAVASLAVEMAQRLRRNGLKVDVKLVEVGALLHDIGRAKTHSVHHAVVGAEIARSIGLPNSLISVIERHIGGGITSEEAAKLGWPPKSYLPETIEEKIVCYADKLIEGNRKVPIEVTLRKLVEELGEKHPAISRIQELHEYFSSVLGEKCANCNSS